jgi:hypothetical protein
MAARKKTDMIAEDITAQKQVKPSGSKKAEKNELTTTLTNAVRRYRQFAFDVASKFPYRSVPVWTASANGKIEEALEEKRSLGLNILDLYALSILGAVMALIGMWIFVGLFGSMGAFMLLLGGLAVITGGVNIILISIGVILLAAVVIVLLPLIFLLGNSAIMHILAKLLGGKAAFTDTVSIVVLSQAALIILMIPMYIAYALIFGYFISVIDYVIIAYMLYLQYRGIRHLHVLSQTSAAIVVLATLAIQAIFVFVVIAAVLLLPYALALGYFTFGKV